MAKMLVETTTDDLIKMYSHNLDCANEAARDLVAAETRIQEANIWLDVIKDELNKRGVKL